MMNLKLSSQVDSIYPDTGGEFVLVYGYDEWAEKNMAPDTVRDAARDRLFEQISETAAIPREPVAKKQWLFLLNDPKEFISSLPISWRDLTTYMNGIPGNVWCGAVVKTIEDVEKVRQLRKLRARRLFLVIEEYSCKIAAALDEHLLAWRCMHCGTRGEGEMPERCPSGSICLGEEWRLERQIHWIVSEFDFSKYGISKERPK